MAFRLCTMRLEPKLPRDIVKLISQLALPLYNCWLDLDTMWAKLKTSIRISAQLERFWLQDMQTAGALIGEYGLRYQQLDKLCIALAEVHFPNHPRLELLE